MEQTRKCPSCGGTMIFKPGWDSLLCQSCGHKEVIPELVSKIPVEELDFLTAQNTASHDWGMEAKVVVCKQCGAQTIQNRLQLSGLCPFCGSTTVEQADPEKDIMAPNGVTLKLEVDPYYDDPVRNKIQHPLGGPAFSYRYDIFDIGSMDQPNIFKVAVKGMEGDMTSYEWGLRNPYTGQVGNPYMSHDEDSATIHKMTTTGVCVLDPTRTMSLIPALLVG